MTSASWASRSALGGALIAAALVLNPWVIGYLATEDGSVGQPDLFAAVLFVTIAATLGGAQLRWGWVEPLAWGKPVGLLRGTLVVAACAFVISGTHWLSTVYSQAHHHAEIVAPQNQGSLTEQTQWADDFQRRALDTARRRGWFDIDTAFADGFQPDRINSTHYPNLQNMFDDVILDPERPEWLIFDQTPTGKVLMGLMFFTRELNEVGPTPAGPIAQWHYHPYDSPRCAVKGLWTVGKPDRNGVCAEGIPVMRTPEMFHVWFIEHPLGQFTEMKIVPEYFQEAEFDIRRVHPVAVHFAIALFLVAVMLDLAALVLRRDFHRAAWLNLVLAAVAAGTAVATGMLAEVELTPTHALHQTLDVHRPLGYLSLAVILSAAAWRFLLRGGFPRSAVAATLYMALSAGGAGAITAAGYYGGELVYTHGAAVRSLDRFAREQYWKQVREVYRRPEGGAVPAVPDTHSGHE